MTDKEIQELKEAIKRKDVMIFTDNIKIINGPPYHKDELPQEIRMQFKCLDCSDRYMKNNVKSPCDDCDLDSY